jgi:hypothetical protein
MKMRKSVIAVASLAIISFSTAAFAATSYDTSGTIRSLDSKAMTLTLSNGRIYHLPTGFKVASFKPGEKVKLTYSMKGKEYDASKVTML